MTSNQKKKAMVFLGLCVLITAVLAISLSQMELQPGLPSPLLEGYHILVPEYAQSDGTDPSIFPLILRLLGILLAFYLLLVLYRAIMGIRKTLMGILREFILIFGVFLLLILGIFLLQNVSGQPAALTVRMNPIESPLAFRAESVPISLIWLVGISLAVLAALLLFYWMRARRRPSRGELLTEQVEKARHNILAGMDLDEVILRCYLEMGLILHQEGGIERQVFTTPTEFEHELYSAGLPRAPVHEFTQLFESVRYGRAIPTPADEQAALSNLQKIILHLRENKAVISNE